MNKQTTARTRRLVTMLVASSALLLPASVLTPTASATINPGSLAGVVTNLADDPLAGITVSVIRNNGFGDEIVGEDTTDAAGAFQVDDIEAYPYYKVRFADPTAAYATEFYNDDVTGTVSDWVPVTGGTVTTGLDASLEPAASVSGRLTNGSGGPVSNGTVSVWWQYASSAYASMRTYSTDSDGRYTVDRLPSATYRLEFRDLATTAIVATSITVSSGQVVTGLDVTVGGQVANTGSPTISGTALVGQTLTAGPGTWQPSGATVSYRWVVGDDATPADDPTGSVYVPTPADVGKTIRVHATGTFEAGWLPATAWSAPTAAVAPLPPVAAAPLPAMANVVRPRIKGELRVGERLWVNLGRWTPKPTSVTYQWYAKGKAIKGATHRRFTPTQKQLGKRLWVKVTAKAVGYTPATLTTPRTVKIKD